MVKPVAAGMSDESLARLEPLLMDILDTAIAISEADFGTLQIIDPTTSALRIVAQRGFPQWWLDFWDRDAERLGVCGTALRCGTRVIVEDIEASPIFVGSPALDIQRRGGVRAVQSTPILTDGDKPLGMISTHYKKPHRPDDRTLRLLDLLARQAADIIVRAQTEVAARQAAAFDEAVLSSLGEGLYTTDEDGLVTSMNPAAENLLGWTFEEVRGKSLHAITHHRHRDGSPFPYRECAEFQILMYGGSLKNHEDVFIRKDGSFFDVIYSISRFRDRRRKISGVVVAFSDITERKRAEETARLYEKAKEQHDLKTRFFANVSHELRTPLTLILGPAERLLADPGLSLSERHGLEVIVRNACALRGLVDNLLDVAKLEAGRMPLDYAATDLAAVARVTSGLFETLAADKCISFRLELPEELWIEVDCDKYERVLVNLLSNAFKFTPNGGRIRLTVRAVDAGHVELQVADSGPGVPAHARETIFERFRQLEGDARSGFGGSGLGLVIAHDFVMMQGGSVSISAAPEGGALFTVVIPTVAPAGSKVTPRAATPRQPTANPETLRVVQELRQPRAPDVLAGVATGPVVLVVEDNPQMSVFICETLAATYRVATAATGKEGLAKAIALKPDLVLTDIMIPDMRGDEFVAALRRSSECSEVPIAVVTAWADDELRIRLLRSGVQDYLIKPFLEEELRARVANLVGAKLARDALRASEAQLRQDRERFELALRSAELAAWDWNVKTGEIILSPRWAEMRGYPPAQTGTSVESWRSDVHPEDWPQVQKALEEHLQGRTSEYECEFRVKARSDGWIWILDRGRIFSRDAKGEPARMVGTQLDITERKRTEAELRRAAAVFTSTNDAVVIADANHRIVAVNEAFTRITGFAEDEVLGESVQVREPERHDAAFYDRIREDLRTTGQWQGEIWSRRKSGEIFPAWENISVVRNERGDILNYVGVFSDIGPIKATQEQLAFMAHHDALTGLPNRLLFAARLDQSLEHAQRSGTRAGVLLLDLDRFKLINDTLGHDAGDRLLEIVAQRCKQCVRAEDTVARLGGDEFAFVLHEIAHAADAALVAEKILQQISVPIALDSRQVVSSGSVGISLYPEDGRSRGDLIKAADAAMYRAKRKGHHSFEFYTAELTAEAEEHLALELELPHALARGELELHYQPQLNLATGEIVGVEALLRWAHPTRGVIAPPQIINIAEESGFIETLGKWIIMTATRQAAAWSGLGLAPLHVAINLSGRQLMGGRVLAMLEEALRETKLGGWRVLVDVEVTETAMAALQEGAQILRQLRALGVDIALDDFGTGYSSLFRLKALPIDILKIDRSFLRNIPQDASDCAITAAIISLAHDLGLKVVAEGVERPEQLEFLRARHCDAAQGFLICMPSSADEITRFLRKRQDMRRLRASEA